MVEYLLQFSYPSHEGLSPLELDRRRQAALHQLGAQVLNRVQIGVQYTIRLEQEELEHGTFMQRVQLTLVLSTRAQTAPLSEKGRGEE